MNIDLQLDPRVNKMAASIDSLKEELTVTVTDVVDVDYNINHQASVDMSDEELDPLSPGSSATEGFNEECEEEDDKGWISCKSSNNDNTKRQRKFALSLFKEYCKQERENFEDIDNKSLDVLLSNFYKAARNKKGDLYSLKSMQAIRFGLQHYFLESHGININRSDKFSLSHKTFKAMTRKLKRHGKDIVRHHPQITVDDMARMQASLDLSTPQGLQHKVFLDTVLYFGRSGMKNLRTTRHKDFVLRQEHNQLFYTFRENHKAQMHAMPGNPGCPVANLKRYISKLSFNCEWMWQRPNQRFLEDPCIWYKDHSPLGKCTLSFMTRTICELAGCNKEYNNYSLRTSMTEKMLETLSRNDNTSQNGDCAITVITLPSSTSNSVVAQINKTITASPIVPVAAPTTGSSMNIIKLPSVTASSSDKATHLLTMQQDNSVTPESNTGVNEGTMTDLTWIELPRKLVQSKDASTQWEKQASLKQPPTHSATASTSSTQGLDKPSCNDDGKLEQDGLRWCSEDTPTVQEDESMDSSDSSDVHIDGSNIVAGSRGDVEETTVTESESQEGEQSNTPILRRIKEEMIDEFEEVDYQTFHVKRECLEDHCQDDDHAHLHLTPGGHPRLEAESPRSTQQINSDGAPRQNGGSCIGSKEAIMAEATLPRFELLDDDQLQDLIDSAYSTNTKSSVKFSVKIFEDYLQVINTDLDSVNKLPNSELDNVLQRFYAGARQKNGSLYSRKSMLTIRFGLQRYFHISKNVDIVKNEDFYNSTRVFKRLLAMLKKKGKAVVNHKPAISQEDMDKIQGSLHLDDPLCLQNKLQKMYRLKLHVTQGITKVVCAINSPTETVKGETIKKAICHRLQDSMDTHLLQYFDESWQDWVDIAPSMALRGGMQLKVIRTSLRAELSHQIPTANGKNEHRLKYLVTLENSKQVLTVDSPKITILGAAVKEAVRGMLHDLADGLLLQYFDEGWQDWIDVEPSMMLRGRMRLNVIQASPFWRISALHSSARFRLFPE